MSKRFLVFLLSELVICLLLFAIVMTWVIRESPAAVQTMESAKAKITASFTGMGYGDGYAQRELVRADPLDNLPSRVKFDFGTYGALERVDCSTAYINTQSSIAIYADMEAVVKALGGSLASQKEAAMKVIDEIKNGQSSRTSGKIDNIAWGIESNTYNDGQGGKIRYVCFGANARYAQ